MTTPHTPSEPEPETEPTQWLLSAFDAAKDHPEEAHDTAPTAEPKLGAEPEPDRIDAPAPEGFDAILHDSSSTENSDDTGSFSWSLEGRTPHTTPDAQNRQDLTQLDTTPVDTTPVPIIASPSADSDTTKAVEPPDFHTAFALLQRSQLATPYDSTELPPASAGLEGPQLSGGFEPLPTPPAASTALDTERRRDRSARSRPAPRKNRTATIALGTVAIALVLVGLFALGTHLHGLFSSAPQPSPTPTATPTPAVTPRVNAAVGAGEHSWSALGGGECLQPFTSPWTATFTVVDCATPHAAQLLYTNLLSADPAAPFPGESALTTQVTSLCRVSGLVSLTAARAYTDLEVQVSFPASAAQWNTGQRSYYCFVSRSGGGVLTGSIAGPGPAS